MIEDDCGHFLCSNAPDQCAEHCRASAANRSPSPRRTSHRKEWTPGEKQTRRAVVRFGHRGEATVTVLDAEVGDLRPGPATRRLNHAVNG
jgi:hypothetical protein